MAVLSEVMPNNETENHHSPRFTSGNPARLAQALCAGGAQT